MRRVVATLLVAVALAGCTVGAEDRAHVIAAEDVPYGLVSEPGEQAPTSVPDGVAVTVHLVRDGGLVEVERRVGAEATLLDLLALLVEGPTESERDAGITSATPESGAHRSVEVVRGVAQVDLGERFTDLSGEDQVLAIAQVVFTLTGRPGIGRVGFTLEGSAVDAPRGDGSLTSDPLARDDFPGILVSR